MANKKFVVELDASERVRLTALISKGKSSAKSLLKARILLKADQGDNGEAWSDEKICEALDTNVSMVTRVRERFVDQGLDAVLTRKKRETPPIQPIFDGEAQAKLTALACSAPPKAMPDGRSVCCRSTLLHARSFLPPTSTPLVGR